MAPQGWECFSCCCFGSGDSDSSDSSNLEGRKGFGVEKAPGRALGSGVQAPQGENARLSTSANALDEARQKSVEAAAQRQLENQRKLKISGRHPGLKQVA